MIAFTWELQHQIKVPLPGVTDQTSLVALGVKFGVIDSDPPTNARMGHNTVRLAVFKSDFIRPLLAVAGDFRDEDDGEGGHQK
jgi:hypothetical protein